MGGKQVSNVMCVGLGFRTAIKDGKEPK
jgi:hypothetical protein